MAFELLTYGLISGLLFALFKKKTYPVILICLIAAMLAGRLVWGLAEIVLLRLKGGAFTMSAFWTGAFLNAVPGIIAQIILIPILVAAILRLRRHP